jgi:hypothetical protein
VSTPPLDELYFQWLYSQVGSIETTNPAVTYWGLMRKLYTKEFVWIVPNDDNRVEDAKLLREEFLNDKKIVDPDEHWMTIGCSMLELMIVLSKMMAFEMNDEPGDWFWELLDNLGLDEYRDNDPISDDDIDGILNEVIFRTYEPDGSGGFFPLVNPTADQREVELWYQLSAYLLEMG